jgi:hypothetical protein
LHFEVEALPFIVMSVMAHGGAGFSRRQFLLAGTGGAALLWAGRAALLAPTPGGGLAASGPLEGAAATAPNLRGLPFTDTFANAALPEWNVRRPVGILGTTPYGTPLSGNEALDRTDFLRGRGTVIGLDGPLGSSSGPGLMETVDTFVFEPGAYTLAFRVAGSHQSADRMPPSTLTASLPGLGVSRQVTRRPHDEFLDFTLDVSVSEPAMSTIVIASENAPGQAGLLLESVSLAKVDPQ